MRHHLKRPWIIVKALDFPNFMHRLKNPLWGHACALGGGGIASFGFAPYAFRPALWVGLTLLFCVINSGSAKTAAQRGWLFGAGYFGCGVYWVAYSLYDHADTPLWLSLAVTTTLIVYLSLYPMLAVWLGARLFPKGLRRLTAAAVFLALAEWTRGIVFGGFPWVLFGQGSLDSPWAGYLPLLGVYGTGLVLLLSAGWLAGCLQQKPSMRLVWLGALSLIVVGGESIRLVSWGEPSGKPVKVALIQANLDQGILWGEKNLEVIMQTYLDMTRQVAKTPVIIWPESAIPKYFVEIAPFYQMMVTEILDVDAALLSGIFYLGEDPNQFHTGLINVKTNQRYGKRHLVPLGEYTPFEDWLEPIYQQMDFRMNNLQPSQDRPLIQVHDRLVGVTICYESIYPGIARLALPDAAYLVNVSNDSWLGHTRGPWQHLEANRLRAIETGRDLLRAANRGITAIIRADGSVESTTSLFERVILEGEVQPRRGTTPYAHFGEWPFALLSLLALALCLAAVKLVKQSKAQRSESSAPQSANCRETTRNHHI